MALLKSKSAARAKSPKGIEDNAEDKNQQLNYSSGVTPEMFD